MGSRLTITPPSDFDLVRDVCSYGYFVLAPNVWNADEETLTRPLLLESGPAKGVIRQTPAGKLSASFDRTLTRAEQVGARAMIARMLRLDEDEAHSKAFHKADPRWRKSGRSRLFRSPTLFEDVMKTVTSCNVNWPGTSNMNRQFVRHLGEKGCFPSAARVSRTRAGTLRGRIRVGYRDQRIIDLAKLFHKGEIDEAWLEDPAASDDEVFDYLKSLPGLGPYAAGNILMLLGRYSKLAIDSETIRHAKAYLGLDGTSAQITRKVQRHYEQFGDFKFKSYWFELWTFYESKAGPSEDWHHETTSETLTAAYF